MQNQYHSALFYYSSIRAPKTQEEILISKHTDIQVRFILLKKGILI